MEDEPPPVPPKDQGYTSRMEVERPSTAQTSGSKRKRVAGNDTPRGGAESDVDFSEYDDATPNKRLRPNPHQSDVSASEDNNQPKQPRSVRRKKGSRNLSNLNLRHAAQAQTPSQATVRGSRFQEGSLTDKPSERPPSWFTRFSRTDANSVEHVDTLMSEYHDAALTPPHSVDRGSVAEAPAASGVESNTAQKEEARGFFQFGRQWVANFHPVTLWRTVWNEPKEETTREMAEENARKAKLKAEAEEKYAEMKRVGHFSLQYPHSTVRRHMDPADNALTPRDSAIAFESEQSSIDHSSVDQSRNTSAATVLRSVTNSTDQSLSEVPESTSKLSKGFKDRLHFKRPSMSNLKSDLKRMRSDMSLGAGREPSSSVSPVKTDVDGSALKKAASRADLKKQQKLSKRVSDLESKLQMAREELHDALVEASPMPKLSGKYERFTPSGTLKRPKFMPRKLPSLPSERILLAEEQDQVNRKRPASEVEPRNAMDLSLKDFLADQQRDGEGEGEETIKASRARPYPARATSLFNDPQDSNAENHTPPEQKQDQVKDVHSNPHHSSEGDDIMDPNSISQATGTIASQGPKPGDYQSLDAKLKALDANVKTARRANQPTKKRKTGEKDTIFKPAGAESDDDAEWAEATPKKKRKSTGKTETSPPNKRVNRAGTEKSPAKKKAKVSATAKTNAVKAPSSQLENANDTAASPQENDIKAVEDLSTDELAGEEDPAYDVEASILDPVLEEEEEATAGATEPAKSPSHDITTTARHIRSSRSASPIKRADSAADEPASKASSRPVSRSVSPPPHATYSKSTVLVDEAVKLVPGIDGVPMLPTTPLAEGSAEDPMKVGVAISRGEDFEWPEDVF